uniref:Uncharacterized protein n=1 Tax=Timema poppense TaxID=170557 RepID=A0A7R9GUI4_TIMPO|nr:unnamed protein product [Timema poppensis]
MKCGAVQVVKRVFGAACASGMWRRLTLNIQKDLQSLIGGGGRCKHSVTRSLAPPTLCVYKGLRAYPPVACFPHSIPEILPTVESPSIDTHQIGTTTLLSLQRIKDASITSFPKEEKYRAVLLLTELEFDARGGSTLVHFLGSQQYWVAILMRLHISHVARILLTSEHVVTDGPSWLVELEISKFVFEKNTRLLNVGSHAEYMCGGV